MRSPMCEGDRLVADFVAGTDAKPNLPEVLEEHLTPTTDGLWVVWAYKLAQQVGDLFVPLTGRSGYPADARATCKFRRARGAHVAPDPACTWASTPSRAGCCRGCPSVTPASAC